MSSCIEAVYNENTFLTYIWVDTDDGELCIDAIVLTDEGS